MKRRNFLGLLGLAPVALTVDKWLPKPKSGRLCTDPELENENHRWGKPVNVPDDEYTITDQECLDCGKRKRNFSYARKLSKEQQLEQNYRNHESHRPTTLGGYFDLRHPESWAVNGRLRPLQFIEHGREVINIHPYDIFEVLDKLPQNKHLVGSTWTNNWYGLKVELIEGDGKLYRLTCANPPVTKRWS